jgi:hypothetical protein
MTTEAAAPATQAPATTEAANGAWYTGIQNEPTRIWAEAKGWKDPLAAVESAYHLEKLIGFDKAGRTLVVPDANSTPEQVKAFNQKLGVPETVEGYKLPLPEGADPEFSKTAAKWFHDHGVPAKSAEGIVKDWNSYQETVYAAQEKARQTQSDQDFNDIKSEWGKAYDSRIEIAKRGLNEFLKADSRESQAAMMDAIEGAIGTKAFLNFAYSIGAGLSEHKTHDGGVSMALTPAQATQRIEELKSNPEWRKSYLNGDKAKAAELNELFTMQSAQ